jgi:hypothetical protein
MAPIATGTPITMDILTSMTFLPSSIYGPSTVTFVNDTQAYTTVEIDQSQLTKIDGWCPHNPLGPITVNTVT